MAESPADGPRAPQDGDAPLRSFVALLHDGARRGGERVAVVDTVLGREVSYAGLVALVDAAAVRLLGLGLVAGDRVAVLARNGLEQVVALLACSRAGLVHLGLPVEDPVERLAGVVRLARPRLLLAQDDLTDLAEQLPDAPATLRRAADVLLGPGPGHGPGEAAVASVASGDLLPERLGPVPQDASVTHALLCTSGSTGRPKLVRLTGTMTDVAARTYTRLLGLGPTDRTAVHLPMWWVSGHVTQLASALHSGGAVVTMPRWSAAELLRVVAAHDVTWVDLVPGLWHGLLREDGFRAEQLPTLRAAVFGGAPASPEVLAAVRERMPGLALHDAYAMSEVPAPIACLGPQDAVAGAGTVGRVQPHVTLRLLGPDGTEVPAGHDGAVTVRTPALTPGYASPDGLAVVDGWFTTGDLARLDDGLLRITGRAADVLIRGGVTIHPVEVERALVASGLVRSALVVGLPSRLHGEDVCALVVPGPSDGSGEHAGLSDGPVARRTEGRGPAGVDVAGVDVAGVDVAGVDVAGLRAAVRRRVGRHAVPVRVLAVAELPRNGNGKPDRAAARALLARP